MPKDETSLAPERFGAESRKVLLVDDDVPLRKNLVRAFERDGFDVATAGSIKEAHDVAAEFGPDFAVLDLNLQDGYGMELVAALQERRPGVRIVILTGYDSIASSLVALMIETLFVLPCLGRLVFQAINQRYLIVVQSFFMLLDLAVIAVTCLVDLAYACVDPRLRGR